MSDTNAPHHSLYTPALKIVPHSHPESAILPDMARDSKPEAPAQEVDEDTNEDVTSNGTDGVKMGQRVYTKDEIRKFKVKHEATANALEAERENLINVIISHGADDKTRGALEDAARNLVAVHEMALASRRNATVYARKLGNGS